MSWASILNLRLLLGLGLMTQQGCDDPRNVEGQNFPILANLWYAPEIPSDRHIQYLSRYDWVFADVNNAYFNGQALEQLKGLNSNMLLLAYVNPLETWKAGTGPDALPFSKMLQADCIDGMYLHTVSGLRFHQPRWDRMLVMNMTVQYPPQTIQWLDVVRSRLQDEAILKSFDGFFLDNINPAAFYTHTALDSFDLDGNGTFDTRDELDEWHRRGTDTFLRMFRHDLPTRPMVGNGGQMTYSDVLNGTVFEGFPVPWVVPQEEATPYNIWRENLGRAIDGRTQFLAPAFIVFNGNGGAQDVQTLRFTLASALLAGVACSFDQGDVSHTQLYWFDEYAVDPETGIPDAPQNVMHRGYLGRPKGELQFRDFAFFREFEHGLAVCNPWDIPIVVNLATPWRHIRGSQDPNANPGGETQRLELLPRDGRILLRKE